MSHEAKEVVFVEKNSLAIKYLKSNLELLKISNKVKLFDQEISIFLKETKETRFNIIFLDPPFKDQIYLDYINMIKKRNISKKFIIIHREKINENLKNLINIDLIKKYGRSKLYSGIFKEDFFSLNLISSTAGWSKGFKFNDRPNNAVSIIK